jgi:opacity protein-like surface antigen
MSRKDKRSKMKKYLVLILFVLVTTLAFAQSNYQDVVYLKNGSIIRRITIEQVPNKSLKIETADKSLFVYQIAEIEKFTKEQISEENEKTEKLSPSKLGDTKISNMRFGIIGGLNLSNIRVKDSERTFSNDFKYKPGFHVGVTAEFPISKSVAFETGLLISTKGTKNSIKEADIGVIYESKSSINLLYLDIPITAKTYYNIGSSKIYGAFGPYIGFGLSGKSKSETILNGESESDKQDVKWGSGDSDDLKRLDFGLTVGAGMEFNSFLIGLSYNFGLANISAVTDYGQKINTKVLGLSIGYKFKSK